MEGPRDDLVWVFLTEMLVDYAQDLQEQKTLTQGVLSKIKTITECLSQLDKDHNEGRFLTIDDGTEYGKLRVSDIVADLVNEHVKRNGDFYSDATGVAKFIIDSCSSQRGLSNN